MIGGSLVAISILFGCVTIWVFRHTTNLAAVRVTRNRIFAHLLEFRLYADEPALVWRAQIALIRENLRLLLLLLPPVLILGLPGFWLFTALETVYGVAPLRVGQPAVVTAQLVRPLSAKDDGWSLSAPASIAIESPPVRAAFDRQVSWRVRPLEPGLGTLQFALGSTQFTRTIAAGRRTSFLPRRSGGSGEVAWLQVDYPHTGVSIGGLQLPWVAWFLLISSLSALACARWLKL